MGQDGDSSEAAGLEEEHEFGVNDEPGKHELEAAVEFVKEKPGVELGIVV